MYVLRVPRPRLRSHLSIAITSSVGNRETLSGGCNGEMTDKFRLNHAARQQDRSFLRDSCLGREQPTLSRQRNGLLVCRCTHDREESRQDQSDLVRAETKGIAQLVNGFAVRQKL